MVAGAHVGSQKADMGPVLQVISYYSFLITGQPPALLQVPYYSFSLLQFLITETVIR